MNYRMLLKTASLGVALITSLLGAGVAGAATTCTFTIVGTTMTLDADCTTDATILIPDGFTLDGAGHTITAMDPAGGHFLGAVVRNGGATAHVHDLTITTSALADVCDAGNDRLRGILFDGAGGSIQDNAVLDINQGFSGCQEGNAIEVRNAPFDGTHPNTASVDILGNTVADYQKNGITANGDVTARIVNNSVAGLGPVPFIAQNGIQVGFGATGQVRNNNVAGSWFTGAGWTASGVLVFESDGVHVLNNAVGGSQSGIVIETWCNLAPSASHNQVVKNTVAGADFGVTVSAFVFFSQCDPAADNNKVVNNTISAAAGDTGVFVGTGVFDLSGFTPSADNNKVIHNAISGYATAVDDSGTATKVHANTFGP